MDFNKLNSELYQNSAPHRFSKQPGDLDKGYLKIADWLGDLCFYFEQKRKNQELAYEDEFMEHIEKCRKETSKLPDSEFKKGLLKALSEV